MTKRISVSRDPFLAANRGRPWRERGLWPCHWIACPRAGDPPFVTAYRLPFHLEQAATIPVHVTADERYELFLDGKRVGRGSERGDPNHWFYESYALELPPGEHMLVARVWSLGPLRPVAQMSVRPGFLLCAEGPWHPLLSTGVAPWEAKRLDGYGFIPFPLTHWRGARIRVDGRRFPWGFQRGEGAGWRPAIPTEPGAGRVVSWSWHGIHRLCPATLPPMLTEERRVGQVRHVAPIPSLTPEAIPVQPAQHRPEEAQAWQALLRGEGPVSVPAHTRRRVILDMEEYFCLYPTLLVSGGAGSTLRLHAAETLFQTPEPKDSHKGHRDQVADKFFVGVGDTFHPDGGSQRRFESLWWQAGRFWELLVETQEEPLVIHRLILEETRYPLAMESAFTAPDPELQALQPLFLRSLQMCSHETYCDAPYYEELMYAGDTRLEMLCTYVVSRDDRLPRKALALFDSSRLASGLTQARYPAWETQVIPPFALWWVAMLHDYAYWRDDPAYVRRLLPGMRATLEGILGLVDGEGLLPAPEGWNFMDWVESWEDGIPPGGVEGRNGLMNWQLVHVLGLAGELEEQLGEPELAQRWRRRSQELARAALARFWDDDRGLLAEDEARQVFSEHSQALALLGGQLPPPIQERVAQGLLQGEGLLRPTYYFTHYLFEAYRLLGWGDALRDRLGDWRAMLDRGLRTTIEKQEPTRSDCHAWASHPIFHYFATILGIRPGSPGFRTVEIRPLLGSLEWAHGRLAHPQGEIQVAFQVRDGRLQGEITLPPGVTGRLHVEGRAYPLAGHVRLEELTA